MTNSTDQTSDETSDGTSDETSGLVDEEPAVLGAAASTAFRDEKHGETRRSRADARESRRAAKQNEADLVFVYESNTRYIPPLLPYFRALWDRRAFLMELARSKIQSARSGTFLGPIWALADPLFQITIYFFLFTVIRGGDRPPEFLPMLIFGILHFQMSANALTEGGQSVTGGGQLMLNSTFPRMLLPIASLYGGILKFLPTIPILLLALIFMDTSISWEFLWWAPLLVLQTAIGLAMALAVSTLVVFFRDVKNMLGYLSRIMFFTAPVIYPADGIPQNIVDVIKWGPLFGVFANYQNMVLAEPIDAELMAISVVWAVAGVILAGWLFLRHEREFGQHV